MAEKLLMLALSPTMEKGTIVKWHKNEGDTIASGDVICDVETDKAVMEYQTDKDGTLLKILVPEGRSAAVEDPIAVVGQPGEAISEVTETIASQPQPAATPVKEAVKKVEEGKACPIAKLAEAKARSSPLARKMAQEAGIDIANIPGTGPEGRVIKEDVERAVRERPAKEKETIKVQVAPLADETIPVSPKRKVIAERLTQSKFTAPHYYLRLSVMMDKIIEDRQKYNATAAEKLSLNAFLIKLTAEAIKRHPWINATWNGDSIVKHGRIDIALAVAQPDGLVAPVVRDCCVKGILTIDREIKELVEKAKNNRLTPEDYENATFTISNLGSFGIQEFTAIINPPGSAILAIGAIEKRTVVSENEDILIRSMMTLTLSCDHRIIDGAVGAAFLQDLKNIIESPIHALY